MQWLVSLRETEQDTKRHRRGATGQRLERWCHRQQHREPPEAGGRRKQPPWSPRRERGPEDTLFVDLESPEWWQWVSTVFSSVVQSCPSLCDPMDCSTPGHHQPRNLLKLMSIESVMPSYHLILCHPLLLLSIFPSIRVFSNESVLCIRWPKD